MSTAPKLKLTDAQRRALIAARDLGGALHALQCRMGGSQERMRKRLVTAGLLEGHRPYHITAAGREVLEAETK